MKNKRGITLIALVITIIILLILAGVIINLVLGERGIIHMAEQSGKNYINAVEYEETMLNNLADYLNPILSFEEMLKECNIDTKYTLEDLVNNKDGILEKVLSNSKIVDYILNNPDNYLDAFKNSEIAISMLATTENVRDKIVNNDRWLNEIQNCVNAEKFNEHMKTIPIMTSTTTPSGEIISMGGYQNNHPYCAFDGNTDTFFYNFYYLNNVNPNFNHDIIYKFDEVKEIYKISAIISNPSGGNSSNKFSIFISQDENGDNWEEVKKDEWLWGIGEHPKSKTEEIIFKNLKHVRRIKVYSYCHCGTNAITLHPIHQIQAYGI